MPLVERRYLRAAGRGTPSSSRDGREQQVGVGWRRRPQPLDPLGVGAQGGELPGHERHRLRCQSEGGWPEVVLAVPPQQPRQRQRGRDDVPDHLPMLAVAGDVRKGLRRRAARPRPCYALPCGWGPNGGPRGSGAAGRLAVWRRLVTNRMVSVQFVAVGDQTATPRVARPARSYTRGPDARRAAGSPTNRSRRPTSPRTRRQAGRDSPGLTGVELGLVHSGDWSRTARFPCTSLRLGTKRRPPGIRSGRPCPQRRLVTNCATSTQGRGTRPARRSCRRRPSPGAR